MFSVMICQDTGWLEPSYKRLLIITFLKVYGENEWGKRFLEPDRSAHLPALLGRFQDRKQKKSLWKISTFHSSEIGVSMGGEQ